jgi:hypothetical protein
MMGEARTAFDRGVARDGDRCLGLSWFAAGAGEGDAPILGTKRIRRQGRADTRSPIENRSPDAKWPSETSPVNDPVSTSVAECYGWTMRLAMIESAVPFSFLSRLS